MADTYKVLAQKDLAPGAWNDVYTVPGATSAVLSTLKVCNRSGLPMSFRALVAVGGAAEDPKQYLFWDEPIPASKAFSATEGYTLGAGDVLRIWPSAAASANVFGMERT